MKTLILALLIFLLLPLGSLATAQERPAFLDTDYQIEIDNQDFRLSFVLGPFGPGYAGDLIFVYRNNNLKSFDSLWQGPFFLSEFRKSLKDPVILLPDIDMEAEIRSEELIIYEPRQEVLKLKEVEK